MLERLSDGADRGRHETEGAAARRVEPPRCEHFPVCARVPERVFAECGLVCPLEREQEAADEDGGDASRWGEDQTAAGRGAGVLTGPSAQ